MCGKSSGDKIMFIGERLKEARIRKNLSQQELGDLIGVSKVSICGYEKGNRTPNINNFIQLINILEISPDYLLGRDVFAIYEKEEDYHHVLAKEDIAILDELKKNKKLYLMLYNDPKRTIELIIRKLNK